MFFEKCKKYVGTVLNNKTAVHKYYFEAGAEMKSMAQIVSNRITGGELNLTVGR